MQLVVDEDAQAPRVVERTFELRLERFAHHLAQAGVERIRRPAPAARRTLNPMRGTAQRQGIDDRRVGRFAQVEHGRVGGVGHGVQRPTGQPLLRLFGIDGLPMGPLAEQVGFR